MKLFVGNLSYDTTDDGVRSFFESAGHSVESVTVVLDRDTGRSRGFAFVEMDDEAGRAAIEALNGQSLDGRDLRIDKANERR